MSYKIFTLFIVLTLFGLCLSGCIRDQVPDERDATFCTRYTNALCCNPQSESELKSNFENKLTSLFGTDGCGENLKELLCGWNCGTNQADYVVYIQGNVYSNQTVYVNESFAVALYESCKNHCVKLPGSASIRVGSFWNSYKSFLTYLKSDNDATYTPDNDVYPKIFYSISNNPETDMAFSIPDPAVPSGEDLTGCPKVEKSQSCLNTPAFLLAIFAGLLVLLTLK